MKVRLYTQQEVKVVRDKKHDETIVFKKRGRGSEEPYPKPSFNQKNKWWAKIAVIIQDIKQPMKLQIFLSYAKDVKTALANLLL